MRVTILGCGSSAGVPMIGCPCAVCTSDNPRNKRSRVSILVEKGGTALLIDASPDLRQQALANNIRQVDALIITHAHADHCHGIDDLRSFNHLKNSVIPIYCGTKTQQELMTRFDYAFKPPIPEFGWFRPALIPHSVEIPSEKSIEIDENISFLPILQWHGKSISMGVRIGDIAYSTDVNDLPEESLQQLENLDLWIVDCLRYEKAPTHAHLNLTLQWIERLKPKRAILTHMGHELDYDVLCGLLPSHVEPAFDGLQISL